MNNDHLRAYQLTGVDCVFDEWTRVQSTILNQATGTGKTVALAEIVRRAQPKRALILAHRRELVWQAREKIKKFTGLNAAVEMGGERASLDLFEQCHALISSVQSQTPGRRSKPTDFDILIVDEVHHLKKNNKSYTDVLDHYKQNPNLKILGLTATLEPSCRSMFDSVAFTYDILSAIKDGYLVNIEQRMVSVNGLDYSHVRTTAGDLNGADLAAVVENEKVCQGMIMGTLEVMFGVPQHSLADLPIEQWSAFLFGNGTPKKNLIFTVSVAQAKMMSDIFNRVKPDLSAWVCGDTKLVTEERRRDIGKEFNSGKLLIVVNCGIFSEGYDNPTIQMVTMARPTKSKTLFTQQIGRGTRVLEGVIDGLKSVEERISAIAASAKRSLTVLDFVGNCGKHSLVTSADILGDYTEATKARAKSKAEKSDKPRNMSDLLNESEAELAAEKLAAEQREAARKARLVAKAQYSIRSVDPFERLQVKFQGPSQWEANNGFGFSDKQRDLLKKIGVDPDQISVSCGRKLIGAHCNRGCSEKQAGILKRFGYPTECSVKEASAIIDAIVKNGWKRPSPIATDSEVGVTSNDMNPSYDREVAPL